MNKGFLIKNVVELLLNDKKADYEKDWKNSLIKALDHSHINSLKE